MADCEWECPLPGCRSDEARRAVKMLGSWSDFPCCGTVLVNCWSAVGHGDVGLELEGYGW